MDNTMSLDPANHTHRPDPTATYQSPFATRCTTCRQPAHRHLSEKPVGPRGRGCTCHNADDLCGACQHEGR